MSKSFVDTSFSPSSIAIATITHYPKWYKGKLRSIKNVDKVRGDLAIEFVSLALKKGYRIVVIDGESTKTFRSALHSLRGIIMFQRKMPKRSPARRQAIKKASEIPGVKIIIMCEPEKISFVAECIPAVTMPIEKGVADIVVPKRENKLFMATYPLYMYESEQEANGMYNEMLRANGFLVGTEDLDMFFGPRIFRNDPKIIELFMRHYHIGIAASPSSYFDAEEYSNTIFFPIILALKNKIKVESVTIPFEYPKKQKENEEKTAKELFLEKRKTQRLTILVQLLHFISYLEHNKSSGIKIIRRTSKN